MTRCHDHESCCAGAKNCTMPQFCNPCPVSTGTHKPAEALVQIEEPDRRAIEREIERRDNEEKLKYVKDDRFIL